MKIIISPSKTLDFASHVNTDLYSQPELIEHTKVIDEWLKLVSEPDLRLLMGISEKLSTQNWERNQSRTNELKEPSDTVRQAIFAFNGYVFEGIQPYTLKREELIHLQKHLRILSGMYGSLRPMDLIEPYRLEMALKFSFDCYPDLYYFWKPILAQRLMDEMEEDEVLVNLASNEYYASIDKKVMTKRIVTPLFKEYKGKTLKTITHHTKIARGMMVRYIAQNAITEVEDLKAFDRDGYEYADDLSDQENWVFVKQIKK